MRVVIQRVSRASVEVEGKLKSSINKGFLILVCFEDANNDEDLNWMAKKISGLRVFNDDEGKMNLSIQDVNGEMIVVSQFTLYASTRKGNRPSFIRAARPEISVPLYEEFLKLLEKETCKPVQTGEFGASMQVSLLNDGPVTIVIDSKNRE
jgi:D-aminoacyl-tRNA deacylase